MQGKSQTLSSGCAGSVSPKACARAYAYAYAMQEHSKPNPQWGSTASQPGPQLLMAEMDTLAEKLFIHHSCRAICNTWQKPRVAPNHLEAPGVCKAGKPESIAVIAQLECIAPTRAGVSPEPRKVSSDVRFLSGERIPRLPAAPLQEAFHQLWLCVPWYLGQRQ